MLTSLIHRVGTWHRVFNFARALGRRGHSVCLVKGGTQRLLPVRSVEDGVTLWDFPRFWGSSLFHRGTRMPWDIAARAVFQAASRADVVHTFTHHLNSLLPTVVARWTNPGAITVGDRDDLWADGGLYGDGSDRSFWGTLDYRFHSWTERGMGRWLGATTVVSDDLMERARASGAPAARIRKVINGCPIDRIWPGDRRGARATLGLPADRSILLFIGVGQYDVDLIVDALRLLRRAHPESALPLTVLIGPNEEWMRGLARERGVDDAVLATGSLPEAQLIPYLHAADIGLLPFADRPLNRARFPIKIGDYLAAGLPVLTNDVGEMGRIVRAEQVGLATASSSDAYAAGLWQMLSDPGLLAEQRSRARPAAERMSWDAVGADLERFYFDLGAPRGHWLSRPLTN
jgi:glycosyltransferase involved in cell wall biosynthesis